MSKEDQRVIIFDTTLRDGEQSPGIALNKAEKLQIAHQLAKAGVDVIEAGFPIASDGDFEAVQAIAREVKGPVICGLSRAVEKDIDRCWEAIKDAEKTRIHTFIATSPVHMKSKLKMTPDQVKANAVKAVAHAKTYTDDIEFSPEDASRSDFDFMCEVLQAVVDAGATTLNIPDTVGFTTPHEFGERIANVRKKVKGNYIISTHCHNDLGMAVANSMSGVLNGARQVEVAVNGIGERAGNAALEEIVMTIKTRPEAYVDVWTGINSQELLKTSQLVSRLTGYPVQYNKAVVGRNAFAHESGIHQDGVLKERTTYEIMDPSVVGQAESSLVLGKHSGRHAFTDAIAKLGIELDDDAMQRTFKRFKELADRKLEMRDEDLRAIATIEIGYENIPENYYLINFEISVSTNTTPKASVVMKRKGKELTASAAGDGSIDALINAIKAATGSETKLVNYRVESVSEGNDALAYVTIGARDGEFETTGIGLSSDTVAASARAFVDAVNNLNNMKASKK